MQKKLERLQLSGGEAVSQVEKDMSILKNENRDLKAELAALQQEYAILLEKLKSLENTMGNLTSGNEEMIAREKHAAEERAAVQREREIKHANELQELENKAKNVEIRLKTDFNQARSEWSKAEAEMKDTHDTMKRSKDKEIDSLRRCDSCAILCLLLIVTADLCLYFYTLDSDLTDKKAQFAQEISSATIQIDDYKKASEAAMKRADEAEYFAKIIQVILFPLKPSRLMSHCANI